LRVKQLKSSEVATAESPGGNIVVQSPSNEIIKHITAFM